MVSSLSGPHCKSQRWGQGTHTPLSHLIPGAPRGSGTPVPQALAHNRHSTKEGLMELGAFYGKTDEGEI